MKSKIFFMTINPGGFGKLWAAAALALGHRVIVSLEDPSSISDLAAGYSQTLLSIKHNPEDRQAGFLAIDEGIAHFGRIDVAVDAGFNLIAGTAKPGHKALKTLIEDELFGLSWLVQGVIPHMKSQGGGHIVQVASLPCRMAADPLRHSPSSPWGMGSFLENVALQIRPLNIKFTLIEAADMPSNYAPADTGAVKAEDHRRFFEILSHSDSPETGKALMQLTAMQDPPLRYRFGEEISAVQD